jgi:hypothetical protein
VAQAEFVAERGQLAIPAAAVTDQTGISKRPRARSKSA